jgi:glycolate oxidase iron-sulfur subunit
MLGLDSGALAPDDPTVVRHLEACLTCRACERACPSGVPYGRLIDAARARLRAARPAQARSAVDRARDLLIGHPGRLRAAMLAGRIATLSGLRRLAEQGDGLSARAARLLPRKLPAPARLAPHYPAVGEARGTVALFTGCTGPDLDADALRAAVELLRHWGMNVRVPANQGCCGAMHAHAGDPTTAARLGVRNHEAFEHPGWSAVVGIATGCVAELAGSLARGSSTLQVRDICAYLAAHQPPSPPPFSGADGLRVAVHDACSSRNILRSEQAVYTLLRQVPGLECFPLPGNALCCGAAGTHMLTHAGQADALLSPKLDALERLRPDVLVSANIGCALHIEAGLRARGLSIPVLHPATLLARHLPR